MSSAAIRHLRSVTTKAWQAPDVGDFITIVLSAAPNTASSRRRRKAATRLMRIAISGARTPRGLGSDDSEMESASRNLGEFAPLIGARDNIEPPGGAVLKCEV